MKIIIAQPIEGKKIKGTHPFRLCTNEMGFYDFLPAGMFAIPGELVDVDHQNMRIVSYVVVDEYGECLDMIEHQVPPFEAWCCSRRNAILANWIRV